MAHELEEILYDTPVQLNIDTGRIKLFNLQRAIKLLKCGKAAGSDNLPGELFKESSKTALKKLTDLLNKISEEGVIPDDWNEGMLIK
ncbi:hypothetical protein JTE90_013966 [Oedothorax gibbosus]|uniref:Uncharacterized protein n=1 Tax=Oedothorax gibbosus TaxID=931172 RepID=A0AAV6UEF3_9ARAC|nr:hypothetical protein JTE90_013966 [Oedothorax gibbosus]